MYAEFDSVGYARLRRSLIRKSAKGSPAQREFLVAARESAKFLTYMKDAVGVQQGVELQPLTDRMSGGGVRKPAVGYRAASVQGVGRSNAQDCVPHGVLGTRYLPAHRGGENRVGVPGGQRRRERERRAAGSTPLSTRPEMRPRRCWMAASERFSGGSGVCRKRAETVRCT